MNGFTIFDGAMGTLLQARGLRSDENSALWNLTHPDDIRDIYRMYVEAGAEVITANTFGVPRLDDDTDADAVITAAIDLARQAGAKRVALDVGPIGEMFPPMGELTFDGACEVFAGMVRSGVKAGADLVLIETMTDILEAKAALLAAKENCALPVYVTMTFAEGGRTLMGSTPESAAVTLCAAGADAVGLNCSLGPRDMLPLVREYAEAASVPVMAQPNAGLPRMEGGRAVYDITPEEFAAVMAEIMDAGAVIVGGCCGTTPEYTVRIAAEASKRTASGRKKPLPPVLTGTRSVVRLDDGPVTAGTVRAADNADWEETADAAVDVMSDGAETVILNLSGVDGDAAAETTDAVQSAVPVPLILAGGADAVERAARRCAGRPAIVCAGDEAEKLLDIASRYGAVALRPASDGGDAAVIGEETGLALAMA